MANAARKRWTSAGVLVAAVALLIAPFAGAANADLTDISYVSSSHTYSSITDVTVATWRATCPSGSKVAGGGYEISNYPHTTVYAEVPNSTDNRWEVSFQFDGTSSSVTVIVWATCAVTS